MFLYSFEQSYRIHVVVNHLTFKYCNVLSFELIYQLGMQHLKGFKFPKHVLPVFMNRKWLEVLGNNFRQEFLYITRSGLSHFLGLLINRVRQCYQNLDTHSGTILDLN